MPELLAADYTVCGHLRAPPPGAEQKMHAVSVRILHRVLSDRPYGDCSPYRRRIAP